MWNVLTSSGSTCVVDGPNTWEAGGHDPGVEYVGWRVITEGLVAGGDWLVQLTSAMGLVTSNGSTPVSRCGYLVIAKEINKFY